MPPNTGQHLAQCLMFSVPVNSCNYRDPLTLALWPHLGQASASLHLISCGKINIRLGLSLASPEVARSWDLWLPAVSVVIICNVSRVLPFPGFCHLFMCSGHTMLPATRPASAYRGALVQEGVRSCL